MPQPKKSKSSALTKEHFDQALKNLVTTDTLDKKLQGLVTNETLDRKLAAQTKDLKAYTDDQTDTIGRMVKNAFDEHEKNFLQEQFDRLAATQSLASEIQSLRLDVKTIKERVEKLETAKQK